jgi:aspartate kinase
MVAVVKLGGSVLTGLDAYPRVAAALAERLANEPSRKLVVVVSAKYGATDDLLAVAESLGPRPDSAALDLLWSTGELRSVALVTLALNAAGIDAVGLNVHQTGLRSDSGDDPERSCYVTINPLQLAAALAGHSVVVVPGFLARGDGDSVVSLGRGGSDLTAVVLAIALDAATCELVKDVPGYFTADPALDATAEPLALVTYDEALAKERDGCGLVQRAAIEAAAGAALPIRIRSLDTTQGSSLLSLRSVESEAVCGNSGPDVLKQRAERA